ncbi:MAG TPA: pilus assembly protein TadG-related protein [Sphingomicrobium sp.]|jgi:hypothetical protein|nr:pilus assembly protein TadG-related protein [Sphingomicrobium sp.]
MISWFRKLWQDKRGNAIMIAGAMLPLVVGAAGLATDTIQWTLWKRQLQRAADSAAIAGVYTRQAANGATSGVSAAVSHDLTIDNHVWMALKTGFPQVTFPADSGVKTNQVQVTLAIQQRLPFSSMFMAAPPTIRAVSTAATVPAGGFPCFDATDTSAVIGLNFSGNASIESPDCDGFSNANSANTSVAKGSSDISLRTIGGVGGIQQSNNFHVSAYRPYSPPIPDPFASVTPDPSAMKCDVGVTTTKGKNTTTTYGAYALSDSDNGNVGNLKTSDGSTANCFSSISVASNRTLVLPDNQTYYVNGGDLDIQGSLSCNSCTIVLTNKSAASPIGNIKVNASAAINMTAPNTGTYKGIAIYQDRRATDCNNCNKINGNSGSIVQGALYFPSRELEYNGTGTTSAICTMFVAKRLNFSGNSATSNKFRGMDDPVCAAYGLGGGQRILMVRLVG